MNIKEDKKKDGPIAKFRKKYPGLVMLIATISVFGTVFTTTNLWFGVQVRPTWHWEYKLLEKKVMTLQMEQIAIERILLSRDLARFESLREGYINRGERVPDWLDEEIATIKTRITRLGEKIHKQE